MSGARKLAGLAPIISRNYSGSTTVANNATAPASESGRFFQMNLSGGVQVFNLPATANLLDGYSTTVRAVGTPSGYLTAYVQAEAGKIISYRGIDAQKFYLIGQGEAFRFTWLAGLNLWMAECVLQPGRVQVSGSHPANSYGNGPTGSFAPVPIAQINGPFNAAFALSGSQLVVPVIGVYAMNLRTYRYASDGVNHVGYLIAGNSAGSSYNSDLGYSIKTILGGAADMLNVEYSEVYKTGEGPSAWQLSDAVALYFHYGNSLVGATLTSR